MSTMKSTEKVLKMIEDWKNKMVAKKKERGAWSENVTVCFKYDDDGRYGFLYATVFKHTQGKEDFEDWSKVFALTQEKGYYIQKFSMRYAHCAQFIIHLARSKDCFTTNVDVDVIDALKGMTQILIGIVGTEDNEVAKERHSLNRTKGFCHDVVKYTNMVKNGEYCARSWGVNRWFVEYLDDSSFNVVKSETIGYGQDTWNALWSKLVELKDGYNIVGWRVSKNIRVTVRKLKYHKEGNIAKEVCENVHRLMRAA